MRIKIAFVFCHLMPMKCVMKSSIISSIYKKRICENG